MEVNKKKNLRLESASFMIVLIVYLVLLYFIEFFHDEKDTWNKIGYGGPEADMYLLVICFLSFQLYAILKKWFIIFFAILTFVDAYYCYAYFGADFYSRIYLLFIMLLSNGEKFYVGSKFIKECHHESTQSPNFRMGMLFFPIYCAILTIEYAILLMCLPACPRLLDSDILYPMYFRLRSPVVYFSTCCHQIFRIFGCFDSEAGDSSFMGSYNKVNLSVYIVIIIIVNTFVVHGNDR